MLGTMTAPDHSAALAATEAMTPEPAPAPAATPRAGLGATARMAAASLARRSTSPVLFAGLVRVAEFAAILLVGILAYVAYVVPADGFDARYVLSLIGGALLAVLFIDIARGYTIAAFRHGASELGRVFIAWTAVLAVFALATFLAKSGAVFSRVWVASWYVGGLVAFAGIRLALAGLVREWTRVGRLQRRAVIVGGGEVAADLIAALTEAPDNDIRICGIFDDRQGDRSPAAVAGYPKLGTVAELVDFGRVARIDLLIMSLPLTAENRLLQLMKQLWVLPVDIRLSAHTNKLRFRPRAYSFIGNVPFLDVFDKPIRDWDHVVKRAFDLIIASLTLMFLSPVMLATALAIRLESPGPVLFRQKRYGFNNEVIDVLKFRSMYHHFADPRGEEGGDARRPARDTRRPLHSQDLDRRTAAALQRAPGRAVAGRAAAARGERAHVQPPVRGSGGRLLRAPSREARRHRLGADQRLARRDRHAGQDPPANRMRSPLHRELVGVVRPEDPVADAVQADESGECILSATAIPAGTAVRWAMGTKVADWTIAFTIFLGGFVMVEPAPYDLFLVLVVVAWAALGLKLNRHFMPMTGLMLAYAAGGFLSFTQLDDFGKPLVYMATTCSWSPPRSSSRR